MIAGPLFYLISRVSSTICTRVFSFKFHSEPAAAPLYVHSLLHWASDLKTVSAMNVSRMLSGYVHPWFGDRATCLSFRNALQLCLCL